MKTLDIIALVATHEETALIEAALRPFSCTLEFVTEFELPAKMVELSQCHFDMMILAGPLTGYACEPLLELARTASPRSLLVLALNDMAQATLLADRYNGHSFPWPFDTDQIRPMIFRAENEALALHRRQEARFRVFATANINTDRENLPALLVNLSEGGAMLLADSTAAQGEDITVEVSYGADTFQLSGIIKHRGHSAELKKAVEWDPFLLGNRDSIIGMEFNAASTPIAAALRQAVHLERRLKRVRVLSIPALPELIRADLQRLDIETEELPHVPDSLPQVPALLLINLNAITTSDREKLVALRRRTVIIGVLDGPLETKASAPLVSTFSAVFRLPYHNELLAQHIREFFGPVERQFPRIDEPFKATLTLPDGAKLETRGLDYSFQGCAVHSPVPVVEDTLIAGLLFLSKAVRPYVFAGNVVYCKPADEGFKLGMRLRVQDSQQTGYQTYLNNIFVRRLQDAWRERLKHLPL